MEFEWDEAKAEANFRKHGVSFVQAQMTFDDPLFLVWEDVAVEGEQRFNRIAMAGNRVLHVTWTWREERVALSPPGWQPGGKGKSTMKPNSKSSHAPKDDWSRADAMSDGEIEAAALSDPDCPPATEEQLARAAAGRKLRLLRAKLGLSQEEFARRYALPLGTIRDWEQGKHAPDTAARVLLKVIEKEPDRVARVLAE
jgi:putative transcriptional regulator